MNQFSVVGRLTKDPELKELENGSKVCNITIAVDRDYKDKDKNKITDFLNYALWDKQAENICNISKKGSVVYLEGFCSTKEIETVNGKIPVPNFNVNSYRHIAAAKNYDNDVEKEEVQEVVK